jgi:hypothetical protein
MTDRPLDIRAGTLHEIAETERKTIVACSGCGAQTVVEPGEEPLGVHVGPCPVAHTIARAERQFIEMSGAAWLS